MNYTENYQLPQWEKSDRIMMEDFNDQNSKLESALNLLATGQPKLIYGTYKGAGDTAQTVTVGFQPVWVIIARPSNNAIVVLRGNNMYGVTITEDGFAVIESNGSLNSSGITYYYVAVA